jgi:ADP-ribose pyrophosphatase
VVVVAVTKDGRLVLTNEFRVPIGGYEISFPAGLIDEDDYKGVNIKEAACRAAIREFKEETGMDFCPKEISPVNLYSSAGMTDESVCVVIGQASGEPNYDLQEASEDIEVMLLQKEELSEIMSDDTKLFSKVAWPFLWAFKIWGMPNFEPKN